MIPSNLFDQHIVYQRNHRGNAKSSNPYRSIDCKSCPHHGYVKLMTGVVTDIVHRWTTSDLAYCGCVKSARNQLRTRPPTTSNSFQRPRAINPRLFAPAPDLDFIVENIR